MKQHTLLLYDTLPFNLQKGAAASQEETLPGSAPRQDWKSDFKPGAHGTFFKDCTILCQVTKPQLMRFNVIYIIKSILGKNKTSESYTLKLKRFYCSVWLFEFSLVSTVTGVEFLHTTQQTTTSVSCERRLLFILCIYLQLGCCCCLFSIVFFWRANTCQQVQDIEFMQIEMKVIEGLKVGNDCLKSMHEVGFAFMFYVLSFCV